MKTTRKPGRLGKKLKQLRARADLTQEQLATAAGVDWSIVWRIETGERDGCTLDTAAKLARALAVSLDELAS